MGVQDIQNSQFCNENTLNIFSDASIIGKSGNFKGCYGVVAVVKDDIIDQTYRMVSYTTNNNSEIKGIRAALDIAMRYRFQFPFINIFSDSLISINGLKSYILGWRYNPNDGCLYTKMKKKVVNQEIFIESYRILKELEAAPCMICLYHQPGHVENGYNNLVKAADTFRKTNVIRGNIDLNFMRYISTWNNYVDNTSRSMLRRNKKNEQEFIDPLIFTVQQGDTGWL
jgi:ribonuclease HI